MTFNGILDKETDTVTFLPIQYAEHPSRENRWRAPKLIESYDTPQGSFDQSSKASKIQCIGVRHI